MSYSKAGYFLVVLLIVSSNIYGNETNLQSDIRIVCDDEDFNQPIENSTMKLKVFKEDTLVQIINYEYQTGTFGFNKHFELIDLNFDGAADILIQAGITPNRAQPFYDAYLWDKELEKFIYNAAIKENMPNLFVDAKNKILCSSYCMNGGSVTYTIFHWDGNKFTLKSTLYEEYRNGITVFCAVNAEDEADFDYERCLYVPIEELSEDWKAVVKYFN